MKAILRGSEDNAIATFNASHRAIKDAIKRAVELEQALTEPRLRDLERARQALGTAWPFLRQEADITDDLRAQRDGARRPPRARDLLQGAAVDRAAHARQSRPSTSGATTRRSTRASRPTPRRFDKLVKTPGWTDIDEDQQRQLAAPFERGQRRRTRSGCRSRSSAPIATRATARLRAAVAELRRIIDGERIVTVSLGSYFGGGIETEEQLEAALDGIREECARLIGAGKKVIVQ